MEYRQEGLVWLIRAIWNLNEDVILSYLPNFLDETAIDYLFSIARKELEIIDLQKYIEERKKSFHEELQKALNSRQIRDSVFKTDVKNDFLDEEIKPAQQENSPTKKLKILAMVEKFEPKKKVIKIKQLEDYLNKKPKFDDRSVQMMNDLDQLERKHQHLKKEISHKRKKEMNRICKEFMDNDYEKRFDVSQEVVFAALVGENYKNYDKKKSKFIFNKR